MSTSPVDLRGVIPSIEVMEAMGRRQHQTCPVHKTETKNKKLQQWFIRYRVPVISGAGETKRREQTKYLGFCAEMGKREAENLRDVFLVEAINRPQYVIPSQIPFGRVLDEFLEFARAEVRSHTYLNYESTIKCHMREFFVNARMCDMTPQFCQKWLHGLTAKLARLSRRKILGTFRHIWDKAEEWGYTQAACPLRKAKLGPLEPGRAKTLPTKEQFRKIYQLLDEPYRSMLLVATFTGLTISEIRGLQFGDIQGDRAIIQRSMNQQNEIHATKNKHRARVVPIGHVRGVFSCQGLLDTSKFIFHAPYQTALYHLKAAAKAVEIEYEGFGWHTFRRACKTWSARAGQSQTDSMALMGHSETKTNSGYYVTDEADLKRLAEQEAALFNAVMFGGSKGGRA